MQAPEARELLRTVAAASESCLNALGIPTQPRGKTRAWKGGRPTGVMYHYTGGPNGIRTARWFNQPSMGNTGSSCHFLVFGTQAERLFELWQRTDAAQILPVPVLQLAALERGTWHGNWANSRCIGIENRNCGYHGYDRVQGGLMGLGKEPYAAGNRMYEPYFREQIEANVLLTRAFSAALGEMDPLWLVGHSQVWATKQDPGPAFLTMHEMRELAASTRPLADHGDILGRFDEALGLDLSDDDDDTPMGTDSRDDPEPTEQHWDVDPIKGAVANGVQRLEAGILLYRLGWPVTTETPDHQFRQVVVFFQRSTLAWRKAGRPERVLKVDGQVGMRTMDALRERVAALRV